MGQREDLKAYLKGRNCTGVAHGRVTFANGESQPIYQLTSTYKLSDGEVRSIATSVSGSSRGM